MTCDIEGMFHQVHVNTNHRDLLCFIWWEGNDLSKDPVDYRMTVHLFWRDVKEEQGECLKNDEQEHSLRNDDPEVKKSVAMATSLVDRLEANLEERVKCFSECSKQ